MCYLLVIPTECAVSISQLLSKPKTTPFVILSPAKDLFKTERLSLKQILRGAQDDVFKRFE